MKIRTLEFYIKEAFAGLYRNRLMSLASLGIVTASLLILGFFIVFTVTINYNAEMIKKQAEMEVFIFSDLSKEKVDEIEGRIKQLSGVKEYRLVTKEEALERMRKMLGDKQGVLEGLENENPFPPSFIIKLHRLEDAAAVAGQLSSVEGIEKVQYQSDAVRALIHVTNIIKAVTITVVIILILVSVFIISNTIKLTVFARRKEINIMKYIGATDSFIRWPFIIEGILVGVAGCVISFVVLGYIYEYLVRFTAQGGMMIKLMPFNDIGRYIFAGFLFIGGSIGAVGSAMSIRRHLCV